MPKDFDRLVVRLRQFGGWRLVWQYARMGVLWVGIAELMRCLAGRRSVKEVYPAIMKRVEDRLLRQYGTMLHDAYRRHASQDLSGEKPKVVWTCWLQGEQEAPELVKACWESVRRNMGGHELRIVTEKNYRTWVELPEHVVRKYERGVIPPAMFSDLLRLELLVRHGGTWLDATVLCSGFGNEGLRERWAAVERSELCLFRYFQRGRREAVGLSNWFISARPGNAVLAAVRDALFEHWKDYDCVVDYYVCATCFWAGCSTSGRRWRTGCRVRTASTASCSARR